MSAITKLELLTEQQAASELGISKATLTRVRLSGKIQAIRMGQRIIRYTHEALNEYIQQCSASDKSATTGSPSAPDRSSGAEPGTTPLLDRQSAHRLAQMTFRQRKSRSPNGS